MRMAWSSVTSSGTRTSVVAARGMRARSACKPFTGPVSAGPPKKQVPPLGPFGLTLSYCAKEPARHYEHVPQASVEHTTTRSPTLELRTMGPSCSITPMPLWLRMVPAFMPV